MPRIAAASLPDRPGPTFYRAEVVMVGFTAALTAAALAASPGAFTFEGTEGAAQTASNRGFVATGADPGVDQFAPAQGRAFIQVEDRTRVPAATYGDEAAFEAELRVGLDTWRIALVGAGVAPVRAEGSPRALPFGFAVEGGVRVGDVVLGPTGIGPGGAAARAAFALFGTARIERNGLVLDERAPIQIFALATGVHADDDTHRRLPGARARDTELIVYVPRIASDLAPNGYLYAVLEDVAVEVGGRRLPALAEVPVTDAVAGGVPLVAELDQIPELSQPDFKGFSRDLATRDGVPIEPTRTLPTPQPLNATPAVPLVQTPGPTQDPTRAEGPTISATQQAVPLPPTVSPLNAQPDGTSPFGTGPAISPGNAQPAVPLVPTPSPLNAQPALTGVGAPATTPSPAVPGAPGAPAPAPGAPAPAPPAAPATGTAAGTSGGSGTGTAP